jgi:3-amino-5-hydroxybenzoate synthase
LKLAIEGGTPVRNYDYPAWPCFGTEEEAALGRSLRQGQWWRVHGSENTQFEAEFAAHHEAPHALAVANGTVAIELALQALGIGRGDEVIVPAFTFISTSMACQT